MQFRKYYYLIPILLGVLTLASLLWIWPAAKAKAQCGSQASSCKNCHEVQAKDPVNNDGKGWHTGHAFGDFCNICHGGNSQAAAQDEAHAGMVAPMSDVKAACASCHPDDLQARAQKYASILGVKVDTSGAPPSGSANGSGGAPSTGGAANSSAVAANNTANNGAAPVVQSQPVIDYNQRYEQTVEGKRPINWGNVIVSVMIFLMAVGGGAFVFYNERKLRGFTWLLKVKSAPESVREAELPHVEGYSPEIVALLPKIAELSPLGLHALQRLLEDPAEASEALHSLARLDPELVRRIRSLDRGSRAMLLALSGE